MDNKVPVLWDNETDCCGCSACSAVCPVDAIELKQNNSGFFFPEIESNKCIGCRNCIKICTFKNDKKELKAETKNIYAVKANNDILIKSSSGGLFTVLSDYFLQNGGAVISAVYDPDTYEVRTILYDNLETREKAHGSKYIESNIGGVFIQAVQWLKEHPDKKLMFVGTGCQAAGFRSFISRNKLNDRVLIVDLICNGVPSQKLWEKYARYIEEKYKGKLEYITFKNKRNGWENPSVFGIINKKEVSIEGYSQWFYGQYSLRESCYSCPYTRIDRLSDITIGDYWGVKERHPEFYNSLGVSLSLIHTEFGQLVFRDISQNFEYTEIQRDECLQPRLIEPAKKPEMYDQFWEDINRKGIGYCTRKYKENTLQSRLKSKLKRLLKK